MRQTTCINPECNTSHKEDNMVNQPRNPEPQSCQTGKPKEDQDSVEIELPVELALFVGLFIVFFTAILAFLTVQDVNDAAKTLPDVVRSFITTNAAKATLTAIGLSLMAILAWKASRFIKSHIQKRLVKLFTSEPRR